MQSGSNLLGRCLAHSCQGSEALRRCSLLYSGCLLVRPLRRPCIEQRPHHLTWAAHRIFKTMEGYSCQSAHLLPDVQ